MNYLIGKLQAMQTDLLREGKRTEQLADNVREGKVKHDDSAYVISSRASEVKRHARTLGGIIAILSTGAMIDKLADNRRY